MIRNEGKTSARKSSAICGVFGCCYGMGHTVFAPKECEPLTGTNGSHKKSLCELHRLTVLQQRSFYFKHTAYSVGWCQLYFRDNSRVTSYCFPKFARYIWISFFYYGKSVIKSQILDWLLASTENVLVLTSQYIFVLVLRSPVWMMKRHSGISGPENPPTTGKVESAVRIKASFSMLKKNCFRS